MPIKRENRKRYPADWPAIRERILRRAGYRCEHEGCLARHYSVGVWHRPADGDRDWKWFPLWGQNDNPRTYKEARAMASEISFEHHGDVGRHADCPRVIVIVLTVAHLDHVPENCEESNLRALCQRHHLAHDAAMHRANAQATRRARLAVGDLFDRE